MLDPRLSVIEDRLSKVRRILAVASGKGGVGKSLIAAASALILANKGFKTGLLDLDLTNPSSSVILGAGSLYPIEDRGMVPPRILGVEYISTTFFSGNRPSPLRGEDATNAFIEILALVRWSPLDYMIIDTPPGLGDLLLDLLRLIKGLSFLVITTPSKLSLETVRKLILLLKSVKAPIIGVIENMLMDGSQSLGEEIKKLDVRFLGSIPLDPWVEKALGDPEKLLRTKFAENLSEMLGVIQQADGK